MTTTATTKPLTEKAQKEQDKQEAIARLRKFAPPGSKIYGIVRSVSRSGMSRTIDLYVRDDEGLQYLTGWIATVTGWTRDKRGALKVSGCGMDMIFHTVYTASQIVWYGTNAPEAHPRNGDKKPRTDSPGYVWRSEIL